MRTRPVAVAALLLSLLPSCGRKKDGGPPAPAAVAAPHVVQHGALSFFEDDYPAALAAARARGVPLFVDAWAPWCHTCLSLQAYVFGDPAMAAVKDRFVFLSIDTEKERNAAFLAAHPMSFWPTLWVVDAKDERAVTKWAGSLTTPELLGLLDDAQAAVSSHHTGGEAGAALLRADQAAASGKPDEAIAAYRDALRLSPEGWPRRGRAADALVALLSGRDRDACVEVAAAEVGRAKGTNAYDVAAAGLLCALELPPGARATERVALVAEAQRLVRDGDAKVLADDRSSVFEALVETFGKQGDAAQRTETARAWAAFLEQQAKAATTSEARVVFDAHRASAYMALGRLDDALRMIDASAREFPDDYNHEARRARVLLEAKRLDEAERAGRVALSKVYGPRRLRVADLVAKIQLARGDRTGARQTLTEALASVGTGPLPGSYEKARDGIRDKLSKL